MALILAQFFNGISLGMIYVLMAIGLTVVFGMLNIINFAHGAVYAIGAYLAFQFSIMLGQWTGKFLGGDHSLSGCGGAAGGADRSIAVETNAG